LIGLALASVPGGLVDWTQDVTCGIKLWWLGQAGFLLKAPGLSIAIDPYLSDSLAKKYAGTKFPHVRMMPPPINASDLVGLDAVLCSHRHTDHMDGETLLVIAMASPACSFIVPAAEVERALSIGVPPTRIKTLDAGEHIELGNAASVHAMPSAHEELKTDSLGQHHYLGFMVSCEGRCIYHSGDCVPYPGLEASIKQYQPDLALLPINGRDEARRSNGVPGNFTLSEAITLVESTRIPEMIGHHFGMFDFNTIDPKQARQQIADRRSAARVHLAEVGTRYWLPPINLADV
jgi:L-ascorbate metabolism protein UlaG (beta-lactamase superfamily)